MRPEKHSSIINGNGEVLTRTEVSEDTKTLNVTALIFQEVFG
jgi:hypothetical protein